MANRWEQREAEHVAELDRVKRKYYDQGYVDGLKKGRADGIAEGRLERQAELEGRDGLPRTRLGFGDRAEERAMGRAGGIAGQREGSTENMPDSVKLYLDVVGNDANFGAAALGWDGEGDPVKFIENYQRSGGPAPGYSR